MVLNVEHFLSLSVGFRFFSNTVRIMYYCLFLFLGLLFLTPFVLCIEPVNWTGRRPNYVCSYDGFGFERCVLEGIQMNSSHSNFGLWADPSEVRNTMVVEIRDSTVPKLTYNFCKTFPNLKELRLINIRTPDISSDIFKECHTLKVFEIIGSNITELQYRMFQGQNSVEELTIALTEIQTLDDALFEPLTNLKVLRVALGHFTEFPAILIRSLTQLEELVLMGNDIIDINEKLFVQFLPNLKKINLQHNNLLCNRIDKMIQIFKNKGIIVDTTQLTSESKIREKYRVLNVHSVQDLECLIETDWIQLKSRNDFILQESNTGLSKGDEKHVIKSLVHEQDRKFHEIMARVQDVEQQANWAIEVARGMLGN